MDPALPLVGVSYALQLLNCEWKQDSSALEACLSLLSHLEGDFQSLHYIKTYLQQVSLYLMEHLYPKVVLSSFKDWEEAERTSDRVRGCFFALMEDQENELEASLLETTAGLMNLLDAILPSRTDRLGWDVPLVACLADALSLTAQLGLIISALVRQSVKFEKFPRSSGKALQILEEAYRRSLEVLQERDSKASQAFVALVLARELVVHSVTLVEMATEDDEAEERFATIMGHIVEVLQFPLVERPHDVANVELCTLQGRTLHIERFPTAFASLYVVAASRRCIAVAQLFAAVAMKDPGSDLHILLQHCKAEAVAFSNILGLSMLLPNKKSAGKPRRGDLLG